MVGVNIENVGGCDIIFLRPSMGNITVFVASSSRALVWVISLSWEVAPALPLGGFSSLMVWRPLEQILS